MSCQFSILYFFFQINYRMIVSIFSSPLKKIPSAFLLVLQETRFGWRRTDPFPRSVPI